MPSVLRLPPNTQGRDFVVGDIHGSFSLLFEAMAKANFNPAVDRLFLVGDLIDRGQESHWVAEFLALPFVFAVRGNHEDMLLELHAHGEPGAAQLFYTTSHNGLEWWRGVPQERRQEILEAIGKLPLAIEIESSRGTVGIIHADVPAGMAWGEFTARLEAGDPAVILHCLWGRERIEQANTEGVPGIGRLFVGHTPQWGGMARFGNVYALDTGAVFGAQGSEPDGCLTLAHTLARTNLLVAPRSELTLIDLREDSIVPDKPFGHPLAYLDLGSLREAAV